MSRVNNQYCSRCIYDSRVSEISFDEIGVCNYCKMIDTLTDQFGTGSIKGERALEKIVDEIRAAGKGKPYDVIVGVSGGTDSSYLVYLAKQFGLRPLAVHYDNTWNTAIATQNIHKVLSHLGVDIYTHVVNNKEIDDIYRAFFRAGVAEIEAPSDLAYAELLNRVAAKYGVHYVFEGHSFITEGVTPVGRNYFDGLYIQSIHEKYGSLPMETYPLMTFSRFLYGAVVSRVKKVRPYWYIDYSKERAQRFLSETFDWKYYGGHHLENRMAAYYHSVYLPKKFNTDMRNNTLAALVRNGDMDRMVAINLYESPPMIDGDLVEYFKRRLEISDIEYENIMAAEPRSWHEFPNYKRRFEILRPFFYILAKKNLVPMSFYMKYCFPERLAK